MSLVLSKKEIYQILEKRQFSKSKEDLLLMLEITKNNFIKYTCGCDTLSHDAVLNPIMWQMAHVLYFYNNLILKNLSNCIFLKIENLNENYDSFITPLEYREYRKISHHQCIVYFNEIIEILKDYVKRNTITNIESYLISLGVLHNEMHNEAFIFSKLKLSNILDFSIHSKNENLISDINFIKYESSYFNQGSKDNKDYLVFDNEMPEFKVKINEFLVSKYPITEYLFLQFVKNGGYNNKKYWCDVSYKWKEKNKINMPLYWYLRNGNYYKKINNSEYSVISNIPISNISYYEAKAYCKWKGVRLPKESEWEYVSTNEGKTQFPWGNNLPNDIKCNINYKNFIMPVDYYKNGDNKKQVSQLIGNIWEWCEEAIYPYDGFVIDPVYREMSYPFFGFKKICKGGCFAVQDFLIHPRYRNAQYPDCRVQFIGFRVCI